MISRAIKMFFCRGLVWLIVFAPIGAVSAAETLTVAVSSNFAEPLRKLSEGFSSETGHTLRIVAGATGAHYARIVQGAPYDLFLSADKVTPARLLDEGLAVPDSGVTYATGVLVVWAPGKVIAGGAAEVLDPSGYRVLAIANPKLAPYGMAAKETLRHVGYWTALEPEVVRAENVGQTYFFVASGHAERGFVALSQAIQKDLPRSEYWRVPAELHSPLHQDAVLLQESLAAREFLAFIMRKDIQAQIRSMGYADSGT